MVAPSGTLIHKPTDSSASKAAPCTVSVVPAVTVELPSAASWVPEVALTAERLASRLAAEALPAPTRLVASASPRAAPANHRVYILLNIFLSPWLSVGFSWLLVM